MAPCFQRLPADPEMSGFNTALDSDAMATLFSDHVFDGQAVGACRVVRFRYRPGDRLIVVYEADVHGGGSGATRRLLTGRIHAGRAPRAAKVGRGHGKPAVISELDMKVDVFPVDRRLPALQSFVVGPGEAALALLQRGCPDVRIDPGSIEMAVMRYRPGLSATLRYRFAGTDDPVTHHTRFIKVTSDRDIAAASDAARHVNAALARSYAPLRLSVPCAVDQDNGAALYHPAAGSTPLALAESGCDAAVVAGRVGAQLAALHTTDVSGLSTASARDIADTIDRATDLVSWACPELNDHVVATAARAGRLAVVETSAPVHRDMKPDHIFLSDDGHAEMIDTGSVAAGHPLIDVGCLLARIDLLAATGALARARASAINTSLCAAYFDRVPRAWHAALEPARAYGALLVATHAIQGLLPDWRTIVRSELETAAAAWGRS